MTDTAVSQGLARFRLILWVLVAIAAIGATALFLLRPPADPNRPLGLTGEPFTLASTKGGTFTEQSLVGTPSLIFFGYTFCPDVCPTTMAEAAAWRNELGLSGDQLRTIFVTIDPDRDTLDAVKAYVEGYDTNVIGLVGTAEQTEAVKKAFGVIAEKASDDEVYLMNHTASVFLVGADGRYEGTIAFGENRDTAIAKIRKLMAG